MASILDEDGSELLDELASIITDEVGVIVAVTLISSVPKGGTGLGISG